DRPFRSGYSKTDGFAPLRTLVSAWNELERRAQRAVAEHRVDGGTARVLGPISAAGRGHPLVVCRHESRGGDLSPAHADGDRRVGDCFAEPSAPRSTDRTDQNPALL